MKKIKDFYVTIKKYFIDQYIDLLHKMRHMKETNLEVAMFHIEKGHINDALFRLRFMKFFNFDIPETDYYTAICYLKKSNPQKALQYFTRYLQNHSLLADKLLIKKAKEHIRLLQS